MIRPILIAMAVGGMALPAGAQIMGARELSATGQVQGAAGAAAKADLYYLAGEMGAKEVYTLTVKGPASITLFSRQGIEILSAEGSGTVKLEAVLPATDIYTLAIARKVPAQPYTLRRQATIPTLAEALLAQGMGFIGTMDDGSGDIDNCWVIPGVKARRIYPKVVEELTLAADRNTILFVSKKAAGTSSGQVIFRIVGAEYERVVKGDDGREGKGSYPFDPIPDVKKEQRAGTYLCKP